MAAKKTQQQTARRKRSAGDLPTHLNPERTLAALKRWKVSRKEFASAYAETARRGGLRRPNEQLQTAYAEFQKTQDFATFCKATRLDPQRAKTAIGRMVVYQVESR